MNLAPIGYYGILQDNTTPPVVNLTAPASGAVLNTSAVNLAFNATDNFFATMNCSIFLDSVLNQTNATTANNTATAGIWNPKSTKA